MTGNSTLVAQNHTRWLSANYRRKKWRRAERRVPFSQVFQLHLSKNKCTSWTFPRRPPGWAIGLAESLASTSCFTAPPQCPPPPWSRRSATPVRQLLDIKTPDSGTRESSGGAAVTVWLWTFLKLQTELQSASLKTCLQRLVTHLTKPHFKKIIVHFLSLRTSKKNCCSIMNYVKLFNTWEMLPTYKSG